jgi:hypothetical protein
MYIELLFLIRNSMKKISLSVITILLVASSVMAGIKDPVKKTTTKPTTHKSLKKAVCTPACKKKGC